MRLLTFFTFELIPGVAILTAGLIAVYRIFALRTTSITGIGTTYNENGTRISNPTSKDKNENTGTRLNHLRQIFLASDPDYSRLSVVPPSQ